MQNFIILKASAGSGKTFNLARKYLEFAFSEPYYFKHILAVTFTNKATTELKNRILKEFYLISSGEDSDHLSYLITTLQYSAVEIQHKAKDILSNILQDFSNFHIYTIDGFFQGILKGFFRELGINTQYNIELSLNQVLDRATDALFFELAESNNEQLIAWLTHFSESEIEEGNTWNLKSKIKKLGEELFTETYKSFTPANEDTSKTLREIDDLRKRLLIENKTFWEKAQNHANEIALNVQKHGFTTNDFKGKSRSFMAQIKNILKDKSSYEYTGSLANFVDNVEKVAPNGKGGEIIRAYYDNTLNALLKELNNLFEAEYPIAVRNTLILKNLYSLGVIKYVQDSIRKINTEQNTILISDSNELIQKITSGSDTPFIYEKSGNKFWNYMIDEFQDTSRMQWNNLKPLVDNSLAYNKENLIVGDVKQAIYRWRNSDWKMLGGDIQQEYGDLVETKNLPANYRSRNNIIAFNNAFFHQAKQILVNQWQSNVSNLSPLIEMAYETSFQEFGTNNSGGFVSAKLIEAGNKTEFQEKAIQNLAIQIQTLLERGYKQSDLVILVRRNTEGAEIINQVPTLLTQYQVNFVSEDSYFLHSSFVVQFIVSVLKYVQFQTVFNKSQVEYLIQYYLNNQFTGEDAGRIDDNLEKILKVVNSRSLVNLVHEIILCFELFSIANQRVFVLSLLDEIRAYQNQNQGGVEDFLRFWENNGDKLVIRDAQNSEAVRILTIHKSKGLEFKVVLIPFLDWDFDPKSTISPILWCKNPIHSKQLPVLPLRYTKKMEITEFGDVYNFEKVQNVIDSLNIVYVAFTRAIDGLYFAVKKAKYSRASNGVSNISRLVDNVFSSNIPLPNETNYATLKKFFKKESDEFAYGKYVLSDSEETYGVNKLNAEFSMQEAGKNIKVRRNIRQKIKLFKTAKDDSGGISSARLGTVLHRVFEDLDHLDELPRKFQNIINDGWLDEKTAKLIRDNVNKLLNIGDATEWFSKEAEVLNEKEIITETGELLRPDRVIRLSNKIAVIDYKFGGIKSRRYQLQVRKYISLIGKMYNLPVEGIIWYVLLGEIERVKT